MPYRDGTGPFGLGPGTGRGRGGCWTSSFMQAGLGTRRIGFFGALLPFVAAAIRDLANPNGILRSVGRTLTAQKTDSAKPRDTSFTVLDETDSKTWSTNRKGKEM